MAMSLSPVSDSQSTPLNNNNNGSNVDGSRQEHHQQQPASPSAPPNTASTPTTATSPAPSPTQMKRKPSRRANTAERRATHNAVERQRRETLNGRFLDLASLLPNLSQIRRPSKSSIVNSSIAYIHASRRHHLLASRELRLLKSENDHLRFEINEWRDRAGLMRVEEPIRGEGFSVVISGQMEVVQATLKGGSGAGRGRKAREGDEGDDDEDDGEEGEGEDEMIGLGGYGGSYMDDVEDDIVLDAVNAPLTSSPLQLVGGFTNPASSMPPPPPPSTASMHLHHVHQQQQIALNAAIHHSHQGPSPLEGMDDPRIANLLLKNASGFSQSSNFGFQQQQQLPYNPHPQQQQQYQQQPQTFPSTYISDKLWNDPGQTQQYPPTHHQMMTQPQTQGQRSLFPPPEPLHQQQQQYHHPNLSVNTGLSMGGVDLTSDMVGKSNIRGMAIKTKVANAKANARVKSSSTSGHSRSFSHSNGTGSPSHSSNSTHDSPTSLSGITGNGSPIPPSSPALVHSLSQGSPHHDDRSGSRSGSESGSAAASPSFELHSGDYVNTTASSSSNVGGGGGVPRNRMNHHHVGFMGLAATAGPGMNMSSGGMSMGGGGCAPLNMAGMTYGGPGHPNGNAMMMMMM